jgi:hypothetical protein
MPEVTDIGIAIFGSNPEIVTSLLVYAIPTSLFVKLANENSVGVISASLVSTNQSLDFYPIVKVVP